MNDECPSGSFIRHSSFVTRPSDHLMEGTCFPFKGRLGARVVALLVLAVPMHAQTGPPKEPASALPPGLAVRIHAEPDKATIGDPIRIELDVTLPGGYQVIPPKFEGQIGDFSILELYPGPTVPELNPAGQSRQAKSPGRAGTDGSLHHRIRIVTAVYKTGTFTFPSLALTLRDPEGRSTPLPTPTTQVAIQSLLAPQDQQLKDLKRQAEIPEPTRWLLWLALGFVAAVLVAGALWFYRRRKKASFAPSGVPQLDPFQLVEAELRDLLARGLLEKHRVKHFYVALSDIVKKVLEAGYGIPAVEKTTDEIIEAFRREKPDHRDETNCIESFLALCDLVKFAKFIPEQAANEQAVQSAFRILEMGRSQHGTSATVHAVHLGEGA
jgi:LPXTG-motif cell wall-anchored protein